MYYCVVYFLEGNVSKIEEFRKKHGDFTSNVVRAHVTLVFPIATAKIGEEDLKKHVENIASNFRGFNANFSGFEKSWDNWLFLSVKEGFGRTEFVSLHDELYTGIVSPYLRKDLPFSPHISLALLKKEGVNYRVEDPTATELDEVKYELALKDAQETNLDHESFVDKITLIELDDELKQVVTQFDFPLKKD
jgi:2'-5' RNA ligase